MTTVAGRYRLEEQIGRGGMGQVWRARDLRLDREVAVKTVDLNALADRSLAARFQQEIVVTAKLNHPNVVTVFDGGVDASTAYLVMELLTGQTLAKRIALGGPLPVAEGLGIAKQVVGGLAAAHAVGLVHRDIKPANVMIGPGGVKLLDFGIAQLASRAGAALTATATTIGTAAYMSPEQAAGQRVGPATDRYALGCLLTTMFTGAPPFDGDPIVVAGQQLNAVPPRLSDRRPGVPAALDELVSALLAKDPDDRPDLTQTLGVLHKVASDPMPTVSLAPPPPRPTAVLGAPTAVTRPDAGAVARPPDSGGYGWIAGLIGTLILALLLGGLAFTLTRQSGASVDRVLPSASATTRTPTTRPPTTRPPTTRPPTTPSSNPQQGSAGLNAAMAAVRTALAALPAGKEKDDLIKEWDQASEHVAEGRNATKRLDDFESALDAAHQLGAVGDLQFQTIKVALSAVRSFV